MANQRLRFKPIGGGPIQFGGVIYGDSADKAAPICHGVQPGASAALVSARCEWL